jgi:hypothetical protein
MVCKDYDGLLVTKQDILVLLAGFIPDNNSLFLSMVVYRFWAEF